jgi:hypothetical protein
VPVVADDDEAVTVMTCRALPTETGMPKSGAGGAVVLVLVVFGAAVVVAGALLVEACVAEVRTGGDDADVVDRRGGGVVVRDVVVVGGDVRVGDVLVVVGLAALVVGPGEVLVATDAAVVRDDAVVVASGGIVTGSRVVGVLVTAIDVPVDPADAWKTTSRGVAVAPSPPGSAITTATKAATMPTASSTRRPVRPTRSYGSRRREARRASAVVPRRVHPTARRRRALTVTLRGRRCRLRVHPVGPAGAIASVTYVRTARIPSPPSGLPPVVVSP